MQIDRTSSTTTRRRPSHINLSGATPSATPNDDILSPRTPKSISKSRRGSIIHETSSASSSRPSSLLGVGLTPALLSETTTAFFDNNNPLPPQPTTSCSTSMITTSQEEQRQQRMSMMNAASIATSSGLQPPPSSTSFISLSHSTPTHHHHPDGSTSSSTTSLDSQHYPPTRPRSSSISSIITTNGVPPPNFDVHTLYRIKTTRSSRKLDHFFGEFIPHDICVREIKKEGLKALLQSKVPLCYFLYHLLGEYSHENLFFFIELEQYETFQYVSRVQQLATAQHIYNTYLTRNSHFEVNLDDKVRRTVTETLEQKDVEKCFEPAKRSVYSLLESSYMRFLMTDTYQKMVTNCGELTTHYPDEIRFAAVNVLLGYIEREHAMIYTNPLTDAPVFMSVSQTSKRRHELIKSMIHEFCRTLVGVEFNYYRQDPNEPSAAPPPPPSNDLKLAKHHGKGKFDFLKKK